MATKTIERKNWNCPYCGAKAVEEIDADYHYWNSPYLYENYVEHLMKCSKCQMEWIEECSPGESKQTKYEVVQHLDFFPHYGGINGVRNTWLRKGVKSEPIVGKEAFFVKFYVDKDNEDTIKEITHDMKWWFLTAYESMRTKHTLTFCIPLY